MKHCVGRIAWSRPPGRKVARDLRAPRPCCSTRRIARSSARSDKGALASTRVRHRVSELYPRLWFSGPPGPRVCTCEARSVSTARFACGRSRTRPCGAGAQLHRFARLFDVGKGDAFDPRPQRDSSASWPSLCDSRAEQALVRSERGVARHTYAGALGSQEKREEAAQAEGPLSVDSTRLDPVSALHRPFPRSTVGPRSRSHRALPHARLQKIVSADEPDPVREPRRSRLSSRPKHSRCRRPEDVLRRSTVLHTARRGAGKLHTAGPHTMWARLRFGHELQMTSRCVLDLARAPPFGRREIGRSGAIPRQRARRPSRSRITCFSRRALPRSRALAQAR